MVNLRRLLETIEQTPVNIGFLKQKVPKDVDVYAYEQLKNKHRSALFKNKRGIIVLIPKKGEKKGHFIVLIPRRNHIEYFSSLGNSYETELAQLNEPLDIFKNLLGKQFIYNNIRFQSGKYNINTCGAWVLARVKLAGLKLREFQGLFNRVSLNNADDVVSMMVLLDFSN